MTATAVRHLKSIVHGRSIEGRGALRSLLDARTGVAITQFHELDTSQVREAIESSASAQPAWAGLSPAARADILRRAAHLISQHSAELQKLETIDTGRVIAEMEGDIASAVDCLHTFAGIAPTFGGQMLDLDSSNWGYTRREPFGVTVGIGAWNYPLQSAAWKSAPALVFGNTMVFKPSEETPLTALKLAELYLQAGVPPGVFNVVLGAGAVGQALIEHDTVRKVSFTGSVATGRKVYTACAQALKPVTMELGGKSALIVFADADVNDAVSGAMLGNWYSNGQVCSNGTRVFVQRAIYDEFVTQLVERTMRLKVGDPLDPSSEIGPMIHAPHLAKVESYIEQGQLEGATLVYGGKRPEDQPTGNYILPAIFTNCTDDMKIVQEEIFGMVMTILPFDTEAEVIERANTSPFGLSAGVFTNDLRLAHGTIAKLQVGTSWINTYNIAPTELPWGGYKQSGIGRENGIAGANAWTQLKSVYVEMNKVPSPYK
ncbi:betaine aldehyde dehydrogenase [Thraustotheca clavata]|uniref:Betaine aldehyde dehydrogenase n=1 Tax=Thraustotheca clavata TaxID=74557 RepID=A0A1V9ZIN5_9STRA|nr:betaine aldehyde dehydrogenase [Thraustotheca clavata]